MSTQPALKVEISFASEPLATAPTWVDVSAYVRISDGVHIQRGRDSEFDTFNAGTCSLTLSNRDRRFDPSFASGPYFGDLLPRKQIRVTATWAAVDYVMFQGWVMGWPQDFAPMAGTDATVRIESIDAMAWLANNRVANDLVYSYANDTIGSLAFFLRNATTTAWSNALSPAGYFTASVAVGNGQTSSNPMPGSTSAAVVFDGATRWITTSTYQAGAGAAWSLSFVFYPTAYGISGTTRVLGGAGGSISAPGTYLYWTSTGQLSLTVQGTVASGSINTANAKFAPNNPYHVVYTYDGTTTARVYVNGVDSTSASSVSGTCELTLDTFGDSIKRGSGGSLFQGQLADVAVFDKQLSAAEVLAFYQRSVGYLEETSTQRVTRILDDVGWPATWRALTATGRATVGELVYNAKTALDLLQEVERSEQGRLFAAKDNKVTFLSRYHTSEDTTGKTVQQIFSDDGGATALPYSTFGFQYNDIDVTNDVTVTTPTTWAKASDATSIAANGLQSRKVDTILTSFTAADAMARGLVAQGKNATWRAAPIVVYPTNNTTRWDEVLALDLGHRVSLEITPMAVGSQNAQDVTVEEIGWEISDIWQLTVAGSPTHDIWFVVDDAGSLVDGTKVVGY